MLISVILSLSVELYAQEITPPREATPSDHSENMSTVKTNDSPQANLHLKKTPIRARGLGRLTQRDSALRPSKGSWSIGLFNPLKLQLNEQWMLESHPLVALFVAPNLKLWHHWWSNHEMTLQGLYGFTTPSWSLQRGLPFGLAGYLAPSCAVTETEPERAPESCRRPGFDLAPLFGARLSGRQAGGVWTVQGDLSVGLLISGERLIPLDSYAPVEMIFAPTSHQYRAHIGFSYAHPILTSLSMKLAADLYSIGQADETLTPNRSPLTVSSQLSIDWGVTQHLTLTAGVIAWLSDQRAFELIKDQNGFVTKTNVMSLDTFPTFDLIWHY